MKMADILDVTTHTPDVIAKHHGVDVNDIKKELSKGIEVEKEHTTDEKVAKEIALDHLYELPDYYSRLTDIEDNA